MTKTVLILGGSGKIGSRAAEAFWNAGWQVRQFNRATDDMTRSAMGADVIVNGLNPPAYHDWERTIPAITEPVIAAAKASGAAVILPGNLYNYGDQPGILDENTPWNATTKRDACASQWRTPTRPQVCKRLFYGPEISLILREMATS